ncbi:hypothetical protein BS78_01G348700 [Paspalum vaginatum]|nr:hypothetical protein BS78_01G348700 [Paspalum vaginatum]
MMQAAEKEQATSAAAAEAPGAGKPPGICDRLQRAFHARPAFRPLRRLTVRHQDGGAASAKPAADAGAGAGAGAAPKHSSRPPVPAPPQQLTASPAPEKAAAGSSPPVPVPPPDVVAGMATAGGAEAGDTRQQAKGKTRVGSRVRKALSSK